MLQLELCYNQADLKEIVSPVSATLREAMQIFQFQKNPTNKSKD